MKLKYRRPSGLRRMEGSVVGQMAVAVYLCNRCNAWQMDARNLPLAKPDFFCVDPGCSGTTFTRFSSKAEARLYGTMLLRVASGELRDLQLQPRFPLYAVGPDGVPVLLHTYVADFAATICATSERAVYEVKSGADTHISEIKRKHCSIQYGIEIRMLSP